MSEWISVKDRLPKSGQDVLALGLDMGKGPGRHYGVLNWDGSGFFLVDDDEGICNQWEYITHWKPLPEPPKD